MARKNFLHIRIPTILALALLGVGIAATVGLLRTQTDFIGKASPDTTPLNVRISNITDTSFTVSFNTQSPSTAAISVNGNVILDDRDKQSGAQEEYLSHFITINSLQPQTNYSFSILSNNKEYLNNENPFSVTTGSTISIGPPVQNPVFGKIVLQDGSIGTDVLVYIQTENSQLISGFTNEKGEYLIPTNSLRSRDLVSYFPLSDDTLITIDASQKSIGTTAQLYFKNAQSVPQMQLSQDYQFTSDFQVTISSASSLPDPNEGDPLQPPQFSVTTPEEDETFTDGQPNFQGTALPNSTVEITINSTPPIVTEVQTSQGGSWTYRPDSPLPPEETSITVTAQDDTGQTRTITRSFTIFPEGSQLSTPENATISPGQNRPTPSPTLTPTATIAPTPTSEPSITPSPTPIVEESIPTPTDIVDLEPTPTASPTPTLAVTEPPTSTAVPPSEIPAGSNTTILLTILSGLFIVTGAALFFIL